MISSITATDAFVKSGKLRRIAISADRRYPGFDEVATIAETFPGFKIDGWFAVVAPTGTPAQSVQRMNREIDQFLKEPDTRERMFQFGLGTSGAGTPQSTGEFIRAERDRWAGIVKELGIQPQ